MFKDVNRHQSGVLKRSSSQNLRVKYFPITAHQESIHSFLYHNNYCVIIYIHLKLHSTILILFEIIPKMLQCLIQGLLCVFVFFPSVFYLHT